MMSFSYALLVGYHRRFGARPLPTIPRSPRIVQDCCVDAPKFRHSGKSARCVEQPFGISENSTDLWVSPAPRNAVAAVARARLPKQNADDANEDDPIVQSVGKANVAAPDISICRGETSRNFRLALLGIE